MGVGVNAPRHDILPTGIDFFISAGLIDIIRDLHNLPFSAQYVSSQGLVSSYNSSPFDQNTHCFLLIF
jgi:hypothetical protein